MAKSSQSPPSGASRRGLLTAAVAATATAASAVEARAQKSPAAARAWGAEADIIVVGSGAAGMSAAIAADLAGASVIILEKAPVPGGTTNKSGGAIWVPNSHLIRAEGKSDPKREAMLYMVSTSYPTQFRKDAPRFGIGENEYALIEAYYDNAAAVIEQHHTLGVTKWAPIDLPDYADHTPYGRPAARILLTNGVAGDPQGGRELVRQLKAWLDSKKIPIRLRHEVTDLIRNGGGEVVGVTCRTNDGQSDFRARKAVIFGSGGYTHDRELICHFQPGPVLGGCAVATSQGDFVRIGSQAGAKLGNMVNGWKAQLVVEEAAQSSSVSRGIWQVPGDSMILVNRTGKRAANEKRDYHDRTKAHFYWDPVEQEYINKLLFMIYDRRTAELYAGAYPLPPADTPASHVISGASPEALAGAIAVRLKDLAASMGEVALASDFVPNLVAQIGRFNAEAFGEDTQFGRDKYPYDATWQPYNSPMREGAPWPALEDKTKTRHPIDLKGPLYCIILGAGLLDTNGGPVINPNGQVLDASGAPIPGLYGAGNCIAAPGGAAYWGAGATIGPAITFGTLAARSAVKEPVRNL